MAGLSVTRRQAVAYRLGANRLIERLPAGAYVSGARFGLQDSAPRDALLGLHARVADCEPEAWAAPGLIQTYSPRAAVFVLPEADFGIFTVGRLPLDPDVRSRLDATADRICRDLAGGEAKGGADGLREACATGRIALRWTTSALYFREVERPRIDPGHARRELCRRHLTGFGPTTPAAFAWWAGMAAADARQVWDEVEPELVEVDLDGRRAWILAADEPALRDPDPIEAVADPGSARFLVTSDLRLLGQDRTALFVGPGQRRLSDLHDTFHPGGLLVGGEIVGAWGRRGGRVLLRVPGPLAPETRAAVEAEALSMPIPAVTGVDRATMTLDVSAA
ncbi:DNA glycosylase AlkZ-like family protein [Microlunatus speluncae]|uniref:DNA glycosylase AlkZ-like family protein n=1 Tax=Microlunatus speluncae TaxID=2594267 RepID=UPI0012662F20|nr:crosslink repair DNA glycosylase YcaQ family protein [Microlunatus speluncae]